MRFSWICVLLSTVCAAISLLACTIPAVAEIVTTTCVETVAGESVTKNIRIDTARLEVTIRQRGNRTAEHYSNTTEKAKIDKKDSEVTQILKVFAVDADKSVSITDNKVVWTADMGYTEFRAEYDRATHRLVEITSQLSHESYIRIPREAKPPHEYKCR
jgi:hypothetical protein